MVTIEQAQRGMAAFVDAEIVPHLQGFEKVVIGAGSGLIAAKLPELMNKVADHPVMSVLNLYRKESGELDIDAIYGAMEPYVGSEPMALKIPVAGITLKMGAREMRQLYNYIKEA